MAFESNNNSDYYRKQMLNDNSDDEEQDFLEVDTPLPGQNYGCISFLSPEKEIAQKNDYYSYNFYKYQMKMINKLVSHHFKSLKEEGNTPTVSDINEAEKCLLNDLKNMTLTDIVNRNLQKEMQDKEKEEIYEELKDEKDPYISWDEFHKDYRDEYQNYLCSNEDRMQDEYNKHVEFRTNIRGVKLRGNFETYKEAKIRAKLLRKRDPKFHVWVGQVGYWLPLDADPDKAPSAEYMEQELQLLAEEKLKNEKKRDYFYQQRAEEEKKAALVRNKKIKEEQRLQKEEEAKNRKETEAQSEDVKADEDKPVVEPTETLSVNKIEELLKQRKEELDAPVTKLSTEAQQAGFGNVDPWLARKMEAANETKLYNGENEDTKLEDDE